MVETSEETSRIIVFDASTSNKNTEAQRPRGTRGTRPVRLPCLPSSLRPLLPAEPRSKPHAIAHLD